MHWIHVCSICAQVIAAYREVVNNLNVQDVAEKWSSVLDQLDKFELEIGTGKYFGGEKVYLYYKWQSITVVETICWGIVVGVCLCLLRLSSSELFYGVTTCLEILEMSQILTAVGDMSVILLKAREVSGKKSCQGKVA